MSFIGVAIIKKSRKNLIDDDPNLELKRSDIEIKISPSEVISSSKSADLRNDPTNNSFLKTLKLSSL